MSIFSTATAIQALKELAVPVGTDCVLCAASGTGTVCEPCAAALERARPAGDGTLAVFAYRFPLDRLVQRFKYAGDLAIGRWLARALAEHASHEPRPDLIVVPPSSRARLRDRGFNPALELAKVVARRTRVPLERCAVERVHEGNAQAALSRRARRANLRGAFRCRVQLAGLDVALVDDVVTTGATAHEMARVLKAAGAARVRTWALARTPRPGD